MMAKNSIATVGPLFNSYRMVNEYEAKVYSRVRSALIADQLLRELRADRSARLLQAVPISLAQV
jgi:hypothetical protein